MSVIIKEAMRRNKRRVPVDHSPESRAQNYALVFNQKGEVFTPFREVNLAMPSDKCTKDTSHAFFCMTILRKEANNMAKTMNELLRELTRISYSLTSGDIPLTTNGEKVEVVPELKGENGDYWCELSIKEGGEE